MLADPTLRYADIQACCSCLGFREGDTYKIDTDAEVSIRTLLRYLRNETAECDIRRELGQLRIVSSDLIPLLRCCSGNKILFELVIRLLMNLTQPAIVCFRQEIPKDRDLYSAYLQVDDLLKSYKKDFADEELFRVLCNVVGSLLDRSWEERSEEDRLLIERILILIRNVLHIAPDVVGEQRTDEDVSVHDQILWAMHLSGWDELLLFLANSDDEQMFAFHTLEIISLMLREQTPELLACAGNRAETKSELNTRRKLIERLKIRDDMERKNFLYACNLRQARFGGAFELVNTPSLSERPLIYHHDITHKAQMATVISKQLDSSVDVVDNVGIVELDVGKRKFRKPKHRKPLVDRPIHRRSILAVQLYLQGFCWQFLKFCYNPIMRVVQSGLTRQASQENDETYFLWTMRFFMAFCRVYRFRSDYISETLSVPIFHWIYDQVINYKEHLVTDKRGGASNQRAIQAARRLELAVACYKEFLTCLNRMLHVTGADKTVQPGDDETQDGVEERLRSQANVAESIIANVFYVAEYQELFPNLLRDYNEIFMSKDYLRDLVEGSHLFITLLSNKICGSNKKIIVKRRRVHRRKKRSSKPKKKTHKRDILNLEPEAVRISRLEQQWSNQLERPLIEILLGTAYQENEQDESDDEMNDTRLFDATTGNSEDQQLKSAIRRVQAALFAGSAKTALSMAKRMWRLWPEVAPVSIEEDNSTIDAGRAAGLRPECLNVLGALQQIHMTELEEEEEQEVLNNSSSNSSDSDNLYNEELGISDSNDEEIVTTEKEVVLDFSAFMLKFVHPRVVHAYTLLLENYDNNPESVNHAIVHTIHRLAVRERLPGCFFQLRLFRVFQKFLHDRALATSPEFKELANLIKYILRKFFEAEEKNNYILIETLFFKTPKESYETVQGYGTFESNKKTIHWTSEHDKELTQLFEAYRHDPVPSDMLTEIMNERKVDHDLAVQRCLEQELIMDENRSDKYIPPIRARRVVAAKILELDLVDNEDQLKTAVYKRKRTKVQNVDMDVSKELKKSKSRKKKSSSTSDDERSMNSSYEEEEEEANTSHNSDSKHNTNKNTSPEYINQLVESDRPSDQMDHITYVNHTQDDYTCGAVSPNSESGSPKMPVQKRRRLLSSDDENEDGHDTYHSDSPMEIRHPENDEPVGGVFRRVQILSSDSE
ncbi:timeless [Schistosoma bovis]|uniref:Timeless n=1 Tax=Schistosoma bovis TaxID=6184 RepID=A0A430QFZ4_SCHBO|nr:timeless [Schistosoma bovis]